MKAFTRTIIVLVALNLIVTGLVMAQQTGNVSLSVSSSGPVDENPSTSAMESDYVESVAIDETATNAANIALARSLVNTLSSQSGSTEAVLVIPTADIKTEDIITINEDMNVMSRIFKKNLEQDRITTVTRGIFVSRRDVFTTLLGGGGSEIQSMYLQGYGALFLMKVDLPLSPPPLAQEEKEPNKEEEGDPVWAQVRQEMYEPEKAARRNADRSAEKYDAEKVENLKTILLKTLKHAANIQALKSDEQVIITVIGGAGQSHGDSIAAYQMLSGTDRAIVRYKDATTKIVQATVPGEIGLSSPTVVTIRAKKSDIDAFSKGDLDYDQFRQRTQLLTYPYLAGGTGNRESLGFSRPGR